MLLAHCGFWHITVAYFADTQLHDFIAQNERLKELGKPVKPNLGEGPWHYSTGTALESSLVVGTCNICCNICLEPWTRLDFCRLTH